MPGSGTLIAIELIVSEEMLHIQQVFAFSTIHSVVLYATIN